MKRYNIAILGATGAVGREILVTLAERKFPVNRVHALASRKSIGKQVSFGDKDILNVECADDFDFKKVDIAIFSAGSERSKIFAPKATAAGCIVIDNSSAFRMDDDCPLVIPEVNPEAIAMHKKKGIISNPNCAVIQMLVALYPLHQISKIKRIVASTYQSVSGAGKNAMDELYYQTKAALTYQEMRKSAFDKEISFNLIPKIGNFLKNGYTQEEEKIEQETRKILDPSIKVTATCVRVPVFVGHSVSVNVEIEDKVNLMDLIRIISDAPGVMVLDDVNMEDYATPKDLLGNPEVLVSRIREDKTVKHGFNMWIVGDNLRKGAALNAVQIAEELIENYI